MYGEARARGKVIQVGELYTALALHIVCVFGAWHLAKVLIRQKEQTNGTGATGEKGKHGGEKKRHMGNW